MSKKLFRQYFEGRNKQLAEFSWEYDADDEVWCLEPTGGGENSRIAAKVTLETIDERGYPNQLPRLEPYWEAVVYMVDRGSERNTLIEGELTDIVPVIEFMVGAK